jgi:hypothetical protein
MIYALQAANPRATYRLAGGWPPERRIWWLKLLLISRANGIFQHRPLDRGIDLGAFMDGPCHDFDGAIVDGKGESHHQADAEWVVIRTQLRGHNNTLFGRAAFGRLSGRPGSGHPSGVFCTF